MVLKDTYISDNNWRDRRYWYDVNTPLDCYIHEALSNVPNARNIVGLLGFRLYDSKRMYRLYMEYCCHGDLLTLILRHRKRDGLRDEHGVRLSPKIPEPAIWYIFEALVAAALVMNWGSLTAWVPKGWRKVIHRDIKPTNVFLGSPHPEIWPTYPVPKLADFGLSICFEDGHRSAVIDQSGTEGYRAPEQEGHHRAEASSATNVWAIGLTTMCLMNLDPDLWLTDFRSGDRDEPQLCDTIAEYSPALQDLVSQCVKCFPEDRIELRVLWERILDHTTMATLHPDSIPMRFTRQPEPMDCADDEYRIWASNQMMYCSWQR